MATDGHDLVAKVRHALRLDKLPATVRKGVVLVVGGIVFAAGVVMIVTPGPAFVFIPAGIIILGTEFKWAERVANRMMKWGHEMKEWWKRRRQRKTA
jgi:uncharacterized protein (TIGR02611 family)